jgi:phosphotransferase system enzyme I (PtsP)
MSNDESSLLLTLEEISQLVSHSHDPAETLANIVGLIRGRFNTAVCSVYLIEPASNELVLGATVGLKREAIGRVRMRRHEGLTGLVAEKMTPVMVPDAFLHPRFKYFPEAGEDPYHSFLGVPLVEGGELQGVLVVQTVEPRTFSPSEIRTLVTVAAQLATLVSDVRLLEQVAVFAHEPLPRAEQPKTGPAAVLQGVGLSPGAGIGQAYVVDGFDDWRHSVKTWGAEPTQEKQRLVGAMDRAREEIDRLSHHISELVGEEHGAILQAQLMIMQDRTIEHDLDLCLAQGASAEAALLQTLDKYVAAFQKLTTPFFQERIYDIKDVFYRLLWQLRPPRTDAAGDRVVLVTREPSVMELFAVDLDRLAGVVVEHGGKQSHAAILARSLGIPMVGQVADFASLEHPGLRLLVDGTRGRVVPDPPPEMLAELGEPEAAPPEVTEAPASGLPRIEVNINLLYEVESAVRRGAGGVGLFRSEFLFLARRTLPTEEEQLHIYRKLLLQLGGRPVSIRTFDLRPDKLAMYSPLGSTSSWPFDWRRVLESPPLQQLFRDQIRAILRAAAVGPARILIPLVTHSELLDYVREVVSCTRQELEREGLDFGRDVPLGAMIEVAAAVPLVPLWANQVSFFALGTNDLTASALGLDRDDRVGAGQTDPLHPGLIHLIDTVVTAAHAAGRPVTVCGEVAADPLGAAALMALGIDALSVAVNQLEAARRTLSGWTATALQSLRPLLLACRTAQEIREVLQKKRCNN